MTTEYDSGLRRIVRLAQRVERRRCMRVCTVVMSRHMESERSLTSIEERSVELAQALGAAECKYAIKKLGSTP